MANEGYHEALDVLSAETQDRHRALVSLMEEAEAIDWYQQRIDATADPDLAAILAHNRDEEKEHAAMMLEWLRRRDPELDRQLRDVLFTDGPITEHEEGGGDPNPESASPARPAASRGGSLGIGSLKITGNR